NSTQTPTDDRVALTNDSIFLYAKEIYYWNQNLPTYDVFNPRQYTKGNTDLAKYQSNLLEIAKLSGYDYVTGESSPKFSYIEDRTNLNSLLSNGFKSEVDLEGNGNDIGIRPVFYLDDNG